MPFFTKKLTPEQKKALNIKLQIAEDRPDSYFDLSNCSISKIPEGVFSKVKILQKQAFLLQHNLLEDFKGGGNIMDLSNIMILNISFNKFTNLPKTISHLANLQKLDISHNKIKNLPEEIGSFKQLQVFDMSDNLIGTLPSTMKNLTKLESLNISENKYLTHLNTTVCYMPYLKDFKFDKERITYPAKEITSEGIGEIQRWFRKLVGDDEFPPDQYDGSSSFSPQRPKHLTKLPSEDTEFEDAIIERERQRLAHNMERIRLEQGIQDMQEDNARFMANAQHERENVLKEIEKKDLEDEVARSKLLSFQFRNRGKLLNQLQAVDLIGEASTSLRIDLETSLGGDHSGSSKTEASRFEHEIREKEKLLSQIREADIEAEAAMVQKFESENAERNKMLEELYLKNDHLDDTIGFVLQMTERARHTEEVLEELEEEQERLDRLVKITVDESERLRKQEIVDAMNLIMKENEHDKRIWNKYESQRNANLQKSIITEEEDTEGLERILHDTDETQKSLVERLMTEEKQQRKAFEALQIQKDVKLNRLNKQLALVEAELTQLSLLEIQKRHDQQEHEINTLAEMRIQTANLLSKLLEEQEKRENRLKNMVARMEKERDDDAKDYWLIQFQRLLDSKPQVLIDAENSLDAFVADTVIQAGCRQYLPHFARHNIDEYAMHEMTKEKLDQIGVKDPDEQEQIMASIKSVVLMNDHFTKRQNSYTSSVNLRSEEMKVDLEPYTSQGRPLKELCRETECAICLDSKPEVVFLPCGHVCTCLKCSAPLKDCPICRQEIKQTFRLYGASN